MEGAGFPTEDGQPLPNRLWLRGTEARTAGRLAVRHAPTACPISVPAHELSHQKSLALQIMPRASHTSLQLWCCGEGTGEQTGCRHAVGGIAMPGRLKPPARTLLGRLRMRLVLLLHAACSYLLPRQRRHAGRGRQLLLRWQQRAEAAVGNEKAGPAAVQQEKRRHNTGKSAGI